MTGPSLRLSLVDGVCAPAGAVNEDRSGVTDDAAWVLDGATGLAAERVLPGASDALWLVERVDAGLRQRAARSEAPTEVLRPILRDAAAAFTRAARHPEVPPEDRPCAALTMIRLRPGGIELVNIGDCCVLHRDDAGAVRRFGSSAVRALDGRLVEEVIRLQAEDLPQDEIWRRVLPMTRRHRGLVNRLDGYWMVDTTERALDHIEIEALPARPGAIYLLLSDGFYRLVDTYGGYSDAGLLAAAEGRGVRALLDELRGIEAADPGCRRYPRLKPRDDATAVLVRLAE